MRAALALSLTLAAATVRADAPPPCRVVEIQFTPAGAPQIAVWIEDAEGHYVDTAFVTRMVGTFGLGNRPGDHLFKSDIRFPYGRRDMALPVWAHARGHQYGLVVMGGIGGNSVANCQRDHIVHPWILGTDCNDESIGYHEGVSSVEPFYCSPRGALVENVSGLDVISCASIFNSSKGAYADAPAFSLYPPRADLSHFVTGRDGVDARRYAADNDLGAISGATPPALRTIDPPIRWLPPADGSYVARIEIDTESDFNLFHSHPCIDDAHDDLNGFGHEFVGQPSVVYEVPFTVGDDLDVEIARGYAGYGDWDGATGALHLPDPTISDEPGSGAGRLLDTGDASGTWRALVRAQPTCGPDDCDAPGAPVIAQATANDGTVTLAFASAGAGVRTARFDIRYRAGAPIHDADFAAAIPSSLPPPPPGAPGSTVSTVISGLKPDTEYSIAVRALATCDAPSSIAVARVTTPRQQFATLHGCFIATAAFGTALAKEVEALRRVRDRYLLRSPLGQVMVGIYYSLSPPIARAIATNEWLRAGARGVVGPMVELARAIEKAGAE